jgi:hypothetical protein
MPLNRILTVTLAFGLCATGALATPPEPSLC